MRITMVLFALATLLIVSVPASWGENDILKEFEFKNVQQNQESDNSGISGPLTNYQMYLDTRMNQQKTKLYECIVIASLAVISLFIVLRNITNSKSYTAEHVVNASGLIVIVFGALLLPLFAETDQQLTATVGILGAIAGYLFGSMRKGEKDEADSKADKAGAAVK